MKRTGAGVVPLHNPISLHPPSLNFSVANRLFLSTMTVIITSTRNAGIATGEPSHAVRRCSRRYLR